MSRIEILTAKPSIPVEIPEKRLVPEIENPVPERLPLPSEPIRAPQQPIPIKEPVPVG